MVRTIAFVLIAIQQTLEPYRSSHQARRFCIGVEDRLVLLTDLTVNRKDWIMSEKRMVLVTTDKDRRGVFFGVLEEYDIVNQIAVLTDAQMALYWSAETRGILGLAAIGPQKGSKITPIIPRAELNGVTGVFDATPDSVEKWRKATWE